jgi:hypothetical protein
MPLDRQAPSARACKPFRNFNHVLGFFCFSLQPQWSPAQENHNHRGAQPLPQPSAITTKPGRNLGRAITIADMANRGATLYYVNHQQCIKLIKNAFFFKSKLSLKKSKDDEMTER